MEREFPKDLEMSLQNLCLDVIVDNFERYYSKFPSSDNVVLRRRFEFLQRKFSYEMASSLYREDKREAWYNYTKMNKVSIDFFVNKHLKTLDFDWFEDSSWDTIVAKFQEVGPVLQKLCVMGDYGMPLQHLMPHLRNLRVMTYSECNDEILESLAKFCPSVLELYIKRPHYVTDAGLKRLCKKEDGESTGLKLRIVGVEGSYDLHVDGIANLLKHMPTLEIIDYKGLPEVLYRMHEKDLLQLGKIQPYNLLKLDLPSYFYNLSDLLKICSSLCPRVKYLSCSIQKQEDLKFLNAFCELEQLHLDNCFGWKIEICELLKLRGEKIRDLKLISVSISVSALANYCPSLRHLHLEKVDLNDDSMSSVEFPCLESCILNGCSSRSAKAIGRLFKSSPNLEDVAFKWCDWLSSKKQAEVLMGCEKNPVKRIDLTDSVVESSFVEGILKVCDSLKSLTLDDGYTIDSHDKSMIRLFALIHPSSPKIIFNHYDDEYEDYDISSRDADFTDHFSD